MRPAGWQPRNWSTGLFATFNCNYTTVKTINTSTHQPQPLSLSLSLSLSPSAASSPPHFTSRVSSLTLFSACLSLNIDGEKKKVPYRLGVGVLTNVLLEKDDLPWLRVPDWSCGVPFIHLRPPAAASAAAAAAFTSGCSPLPSPYSPSALASAAASLPGPGPSVVAAIGSAGVEKETAASSFPYWVKEGRGMWLKTDVPCCSTLWAMELGPLDGLQDRTLTLAH